MIRKGGWRDLGGDSLQGRWRGKGRPRGPKTTPRLPKKPQDRPKRPQGPLQEASRSPQEAPKTLPRGRQRDLSPPKTPPSGPKNAPRGPERSHLSPKSSFAIVLNNHWFLMKNDNWKFQRSHRKDPRTFQDQHVRASELPSLHASEPPSLRVPAAKCLGGIREAQTIYLFIRCSYARTLILVNCLLVNIFSFFVITRSHELGFGRNLVEIVPRSLPQLSKQLRDLNSIRKFKKLKIKI